MFVVATEPIHKKLNPTVPRNAVTTARLSVLVTARIDVDLRVIDRVAVAVEVLGIGGRLNVRVG